VLGRKKSCPRAFERGEESIERRWLRGVLSFSLSTEKERKRERRIIVLLARNVTRSEFPSSLFSAFFFERTREV
jgi:hypothetical protein